MEPGWFGRLKVVVEHEVNTARDMKAISIDAGLGINFVQQMMSKDQPPKAASLEKLLSTFSPAQRRFVVYDQHEPAPETFVAPVPMDAPPPPSTMVPVVSMVSAGRLKRREGVTPADIERWMPVANLPEGDWICLIVDGDSMDRVAPDQSAILVNRADATLIDGKFYVFNLESGETTFKTFRRDPMRLQPFSVNPDHMSIPVSSDTDFYVVGRVKRVIQDV